MQSFSSLSLRTLARPLLALAFVASLAACGSDSNDTTGPGDVTGSYILASIDGKAPPDTIAGSEHNVVINAGSIHLNSDHTYTVTGAGTADGENNDNVVADEGTYTLSGSTITFTSTPFDGAHYSASVTASTLTATVPAAFAGSSDVTNLVIVFNKMGTIPG